MTFRGKPKESPGGLCFCGAESVRQEFAPDDVVIVCTRDIFHQPVDRGAPGPTMADMMAVREAARETEEEPPEPQPDPEVRATPLPLKGELVVPLPDGTEHVVTLPGGAKTLVNKARAGGWDIAASYSRGPWMHSTQDRHTGVVDTVLVRFSRGADRAVALWRWKRSTESFGFEFGYIWTEGKVGRERVNSTALKEHLSPEEEA